MSNYYLLSRRSFDKWPSLQIVYEWEDCILNINKDIQLKKMSKWIFRVDNYISKKLGIALPLISLNDNFTLYFEMTAKCGANRFNNRNYIPIIVDFWIPENKFGEFEKAYSKCPIIIITSKEVYDKLVAYKSKLNVVHWALSISDKYKITEESEYIKKYDLVLMGRQNAILKSFLDIYISKHPDFVYVYAKQQSGHFVYITSKGEVLGRFDSRTQYLSLMQSAKSILYSTPGTDEQSGRTNGYSQVTPRFLEAIACGCHILARYKKNPDSDYYKLNDICSNIKSYEDFEERMDYAIKNPVDMGKYSNYLSRHYTSSRLEQLMEILRKI